MYAFVVYTFDAFPKLGYIYSTEPLLQHVTFFGLGIYVLKSSHLLSSVAAVPIWLFPRPLTKRSPPLFPSIYQPQIVSISNVKRIWQVLLLFILNFHLLFTQQRNNLRELSAAFAATSLTVSMIAYLMFCF
mgnify:CR=1 FL=1